MSAQRFAVEWQRRVVGITVRLDGGFVFYASDPEFDEMDGRTFARARQIERALKTIARRRGREARTAPMAQAFA